MHLILCSLVLFLYLLFCCVAFTRCAVNCVPDSDVLAGYDSPVRSPLSNTLISVLKFQEPDRQHCYIWSVADVR
jgi:hypothetical protein